jgi:hypothetical protein
MSGGEELFGTGHTLRVGFGSSRPADLQVLEDAAAACAHPAFARRKVTIPGRVGPSNCCHVLLLLDVGSYVPLDLTGMLRCA